MNDTSTLQTRFISLMEAIARAEGISPNAGKIIGLLLMQEHPIPFSRISEDLQISRGSVSENTCLLIEHGVIERVQIHGSRKDHFQVRQDAHAALLERRRRLTQEVIADLNALQSDLPSTSFQLERLQGVGQFLSASLIAADVLEQQLTCPQEKQTEKEKS